MIMKREQVTKQEFVNEVVEALKEQNVKITKEGFKKVMAVMEETTGNIVKEGKQVTVLGVKHSGREVGAKTGKINFGSRAGEMWSTPAQIVPTVSLLDSKKKELTIVK